VTEIPHLFLKADELEILTGYKRPHEQRRWLKAHHWRFEPNAAGYPCVARAYFERRLVGEARTEEPILGEARTEEPPLPARHNIAGVGRLRVVK
jgi:hypothetical protein